MTRIVRIARIRHAERQGREGVGKNTKKSMCAVFFLVFFIKRETEKKIEIFFYTIRYAILSKTPTNNYNDCSLVK